jgi:hypothetical protein
MILFSIFGGFSNTSNSRPNDVYDSQKHFRNAEDIVQKEVGYEQSITTLTATTTVTKTVITEQIRTERTASKNKPKPKHRSTVPPSSHGRDLKGHTDRRRHDTGSEDKRGTHHRSQLSNTTVPGILGARPKRIQNAPNFQPQGMDTEALSNDNGLGHRYEISHPSYSVCTPTRQSPQSIQHGALFVDEDNRRAFPVPNLSVNHDFYPEIIEMPNDIVFSIIHSSFDPETSHGHQNPPPYRHEALRLQQLSSVGQQHYQQHRSAENQQKNTSRYPQYMMIPPTDCRATLGAPFSVSWPLSNRETCSSTAANCLQPAELE